MQSSSPQCEVALFGYARGHPRCTKIGLTCGDEFPPSFKEVRTHNLKTVRMRQPVVRGKRPKQGKPSAWATHHC